MSDMKIIYTAKDVYSRLQVSDSTLRKYVEVLQRESYIIKKKQGKREYTGHDVMVIEKLIELSKHDGMTLKKAARMITQKLESINPDLVNDEESKNTDLIPFHIQQQLQQQYNVMAKQMNPNLLEMEQRLGEQAEKRSKRIEESMERRNERIEKRLEERDETLMRTLREKKKPWWKFW